MEDLKKREQDLADREKALADGGKQGEGEEKKEQKRSKFSAPKNDWENLGYNRAESGELLDALDMALGEIETLHERLAALEEGHGKIAEATKRITESQRGRLTRSIETAMEKAAEQIAEVYGVDAGAEEIGEAFTRVMQAGFFDFDPFSDLATPEMVFKAWKLVNADLVESAKPREKTEKKVPEISKPGGERHDSISNLTGKDKIAAILAKANPSVPRS